MRVAIAGAGNVGLYIANAMCAAGHDVLLMDSDTDVVRSRQPRSAEGIDWRNVDACEVSSLRACGLETCDVLVAATGDDEDNLVVSFLARQEFGVPRIVARVNHPDNQWLFNENWGVDVAVSTPHLLTAVVEEAVSVGSLVRLLRFEQGKVTLVEVTLDQAAPVVGRALKELDTPRDATIVAVIRDEHVVVPRGDTVLEAGDEVLALVSPEAEADLRGLLE